MAVYRDGLGLLFFEGHVGLCHPTDTLDKTSWSLQGSGVWGCRGSILAVSGLSGLFHTAGTMTIGKRRLNEHLAQKHELRVWT